MPSAQFWKHAAIDGFQTFLPELRLQSVIVSESVIQFLLPEKYPSESEYLVCYMDSNGRLPFMSCGKRVPFVHERTASLQGFDAPCALHDVLPHRLASSP